MPRGLLIALALLALLGGGVWWAEKHPKTDDAAKKLSESPKILSVPEKDLSELRVAKTGSEPIAVARVADRWEILQPKPMPADQEAVNAMAATVASLSADTLVDEKPASLTPFGLDHPTEQVSIKEKSGRTDELLFGSDTPTGGNVYAKLANSPKVYTVPSYSKSNFDKKLNDLRDKRLLTFNSDKLTSVSLTPAKGGGPIEFAKNGQSDWQIVKPKPYRADNLQVDDLVRKLKDAKMDVNATDATKGFGTAARLATVAVTDNGGTQTLEIRRGSDKSVYGRSSVVEGVYKLTGDLGDGLEKSVEDFRNKKLFDFGFSDPTRLDLNGTVYERSGEKWNSGGKQFDGSTIQAVIDKLRDLSASKFTEKVTGTQALSIGVTYGDQKRTEKATFYKANDIYTAQREGEPSIYVVDARNVDELTKAVGGIKTAQAASKDAKKK